VGGRYVKLPQFRMAGEQMSFKVEVPGAGKPSTYQFRGWVRGDTIEGAVTFNDGSGQRVAPWRAKQTVRGEARMGAAGAVTVAGDRP
jgi:hypothetical protein